MKPDPELESQLRSLADATAPTAGFAGRVAAAAGRLPLPLPRRRLWSVALIAAFLLAPPGVTACAAYLLADFGLALAGWSDSARTRLQQSALVVAAGVAVVWLATRRRGLRHPLLCGAGGAVSLLVGLVTCNVALSSYVEWEAVRREEMFQSHRWVSYDSAYYWPEDQVGPTGHPAREPTEDQIRQELVVLRQAGFDGIVVHECRDGQLAVPRIAREVGFTAVVQFIRVDDPGRVDSPRTRREIQNAIAVRDYVDAYCLGELSAREVGFEPLKKELARLRWKTGKPVTASFLHSDDVGPRGRRLRDLEDFTVRSLARPWEGNRGDPAVAVRAVRDALDTFRQDDKPALLTTVWYASGGGEGFSEEGQDRFVAGVLALRPPRGVQVVFFNSFDRPWARRRCQLGMDPPYEGYTGLFSVEHTGPGDTLTFLPKKAAGRFKPKP